jgi:hypothetical protein
LSLLLEAATKRASFAFSVALAIRAEGRGRDRLEANAANLPAAGSREKHFGTPTQVNLKSTTNRWLPELARGATKAAQRERKKSRQDGKQQQPPVARDVDLVPAQELGRYRRLAQGEQFRQLTAPANSPLPPAALAFYVRGNCFGLALAAHDATGLPIELFVRGGLPVHGYVVDGESAIDAFGRRNLNDARAGADEIRQVSAAELRNDLAATVNQSEWRGKAKHTAGILLREL